MEKRSPRPRLRPRWAKVVADLWGNKARSALVIGAIAVGVFAIGVIAGAYVMLSEDLASSYEASNPANITLVTLPFDDELLDAARRMDGVAAAEGVREFTVRARTGATSVAGGVTEDEWEPLLLVAQPDSADIEIRRRFSKEGVSVPADREIVLEHQSLDALGMTVGDMLEIELPDGTRRVLPVVGTAIDQADLQDIVVGGLRGYVTLDTMPWLHGSPTVTKLFVTVLENSDDKAHIRQMAAEVTDRLERSGYLVFQTEVAGTHEHPFG
ncbi:MAG: ABC transporter permease, partial [Anaerolineae bacterium]|nr:ABC transporter permease [Anaerolineae bacterium]